MPTGDPPTRSDRFPSSAILPEDPAYDEHLSTFNGMLDRRPAVIVPCSSTDDVVAAVRAARAAGLPIAVRGGGHSVAGHGIADDSLVVSLSGMRRIDVDPGERLARAGGGALWEDVDGATVAHGLAVPGGTFIDTGIGGLTLGGGLGYLMPIAGLTCDNLVEAEVVTADGSVVIAGPGGDEELLWALRGGGGNFGVVTWFTYRLTPLLPLSGGSIRFAADQARAVLSAVQTIMAEHPTAMLPMFGIRRDPERGFVTISVIIGIVDGSDPDAVVAPLRSLPILEDQVRPLTYGELQGLAGILPFGLRHYWKGHFLADMDAELFNRLVELAGADDAVGNAFILIEGMVGAGREEPAGGAAFGQRAARWNASALAIWESPNDDTTAIGWARRVADTLAPASLSGGGYVNYSPVDETAERVRATYGAERYERLRAVKRRYDPDNVFRFNHNIPPD